MLCTFHVELKYHIERLKTIEQLLFKTNRKRLISLPEALLYLIQCLSKGVSEDYNVLNYKNLPEGTFCIGTSLVVDHRFACFPFQLRLSAVVPPAALGLILQPQDQSCWTLIFQTYRYQVFQPCGGDLPFRHKDLKKK